MKICYAFLCFNDLVQDFDFANLMSESISVTNLNQNNPECKHTTLCRKTSLAHSRSQSPRSFWPVAGIERSGQVQHRKFAIHGLVTLFMLTVKSDKFYWLRIRNDYSARAQKIGPSQRSRFFVLTKRSAASGYENTLGQDLVLVRQNVLFIRTIRIFHYLDQL